MYKIYICLFLLAYNSVTTHRAEKSQHKIMHLPFAKLGGKFHPDSFNAHRVETLCLQHTLVRLSLILGESLLSRLSTLTCYVSPMKLDSYSSL